jgi:hypothetical protein
MLLRVPWSFIHVQPEFAQVLARFHNFSETPLGLPPSLGVED